MTTIILLVFIALMIVLLGWDTVQKPKKQTETPKSPSVAANPPNHNNIKEAGKDDPGQQ